MLLDKILEQRQLTTEELDFRKFLKAKSVGLTAIQISCARQYSRLTWIRKGDACTILFMLHANKRRRKLHIPSLNTSSSITTNHLQKEEEIFEHFVNLMGQPH
jgi:hypothetical protein